jgi:hypothetical protein
MTYLGLASALVVTASFLLMSEAANAQSKNSNAQISARTAAKAQCVQEGETRVPTVQTPGQVTMRKSAYADCMRRAGFRP